MAMMGLLVCRTICLICQQFLTREALNVSCQHGDIPHMLPCRSCAMCLNDQTFCSRNGFFDCDFKRQWLHLLWLHHLGLHMLPNNVILSTQHPAEMFCNTNMTLFWISKSFPSFVDHHWRGRMLVSPLQLVNTSVIKTIHALDQTYELNLSAMVFSIPNPCNNYHSSHDNFNNKLTTVDHHAPRLAFKHSNCKM